MFAIDELTRHWWVIAFRGVAAIAFGILAFVWPGMTLGVLVILYGAYALVDGVLAVFAAIRADAPHRVSMALGGAVSILAGLIAFVYPGITALALLYIIAFWAILTGLLGVIGAVRLRRVISNEWGMIAAGVLSILFGVLLVVAPGAGALAIVYLIGSYAVVFGAMLLILAVRLRSRRTAAGFSAVASGTA